MRKPRNDRYRDTQSQDGTFSCSIKPDVNIFLDFFCKQCNYNKTAYVNKAVMRQLQQDMKDTKVEISMQDLFDIKNSVEESASGEVYEQIAFGKSI